MIKIIFKTLLVTIAVTPPVWGLDVNGNGPLSNEAVVLYNFSSGSGSIVKDRSVIAPALDLNIAHTNNVQWQSGALVITAETLISSPTPATKIINRCKTSNEITIEAWLENQVNNDNVATIGPLRIVTLSRGANSTDLFLGQNYDGNHYYQAGVRNRNNVEFNNDDGDPSTDGLRTPASVLSHNTLQHVYFIKDKTGTSKIYASDRNGISIKRATANTSGDLNLWDPNAKLSLVNELNAFNDSNEPLVEGSYTAQDRPWRGKLHMVAIYCRALTEGEIQGVRAPSNWVLNQSYPINPNEPITLNRKKAQAIYKRMVGVSTPIDNPMLKLMEADLNANKPLDAAKRVSSLAGFYNRTLKDFAKKMSNREESVDVEFNDFAAMIVGHTRDNGDTRELLYGNFTYRGSTARTAVPSDPIKDMLTSNNHYKYLESLNYDLSDPGVLVRENTQRLYDGKSGIVNHKDPAGLITSRAFMSAHAVAGTNRRLVEFSFQEFLCQPIKKWADNTGADAMVGRDVERFPAGNHFEYQTTCRGCHSQLDPLRGAFSRVTFENNFVKHSFVVKPGDDEDNPETTEMDSNTLIVKKMNHNDDVFPGGWITKNSLWYNNANSGLNKKYFQWNPTQLSGDGMGDFGRMIASSGAFPGCMAQRVFRSVCKRKVELFDQPMIDSVAQKFSSEDNYNLKKLFERIAVSPECLGAY